MKIKIGKTPKEILKRYHLKPEEELAIILYVAGGFSQVESYLIAYGSHAVNAAPTACNLFKRLDVPCRRLADYLSVGNLLSVPAKYRVDFDDAQVIY